MTVTFFGHRNIPPYIIPVLEKTIKELIHQGATEFLVGHNGEFDRAVITILGKLQENRMNFRYWVVLSCYPPKTKENHPYLFPEGMEKTLPRFAIDARNRWMLKKADLVVTYAPYPGNARTWKERAIRAKKEIIECADLETNIPPQ